MASMAEVSVIGCGFSLREQATTAPSFADRNDPTSAAGRLGGSANSFRQCSAAAPTTHSVWTLSNAYRFNCFSNRLTYPDFPIGGSRDLHSKGWPESLNLEDSYVESVANADE